MVERESRHPRELLSSRIDGELEPSEARFLQTHVDKCPECRRKDAELKTIAEGLARLEVSDPPPEALLRLLSRLRGSDGQDVCEPAPTGATPREVGRGEVVSTSRRSPFWPGRIAAAAVGVGAIVVLGLRMQGAAPVQASKAHASQEGKSLEVESKRSGGRSADGSLPSPGLEPRLPPTSIEADVASVEAIQAEPLAPQARQASVAAGPAERPSGIATPPPLALPPPAIAAPQEVRQVTSAPEARAVFPAVVFKKKSDRLSPEARQVVESVAEYLRDHPDATLWIEGHADGRDSADKSLALGEARARAVARFLESLGTPASRMRTRSFGEARPAAAGDDRDARKANHRVEFALESRAEPAAGAFEARLDD